MAAEQGQQAELVVPPTIHALLQARLDRLGAGERDVIGSWRCSRARCSTAAGAEPRRRRAATASRRHLLTLERKDMISA